MQPQQFSPPQPKSSHTGLVMTILLSILLVGAIGFGVYAWAQFDEQKNKAAQLEAENQSLKQTKAEQQEAQSPTAEDDQVIAAFNLYCDMVAVPIGNEKDIAIGALTADQKKVIYSEDKTFAAVNAKCGFKKTGTKSQGGSTMMYLLKKSGSSWLVVAFSVQRPSMDVIERYGIPEAFLTTLGMGQKPQQQAPGHD